MRKRTHRLFQIAWHQALKTVAIESDQLTQEADRQKILPLVFFLDNDLCQDRTGDILSGLGVINDEIGIVLDHLREVVKRHIRTGRSVIKAAVRVFLDNDAILII